MVKREQIILKFTSNYPKIFQNIPKFTSYINNHLGRESQSGFYLETFSNGLLYIYDSFEIFILMHSHFSREELREFEQSAGIILDPNKLLEGVLSSNRFPQEGIDFQFDFIFDQEQHSEVKNYIQRFYSINLENQIEFVENTEHDLVIRFLSFEGIYNYLKIISLMMNGLLKKSGSKNQN
ncbi:hypothetical protein NEF87_002951 [Candidatus Lokiarchaeum ossiferum]|uniref:Uncharacterized protein n=1 Tax=Candidatus Lokiarchaeum ossiferum TaxID=2951803 RepID=A0ABY6HVQ7_9ARCH|nr:hypothetical protein NEF87_002951 [Candidatus Lokiarchaeum sp. B-35]